MWRRLWRSRRIDAEMHDEMRFHIEMETERLVRERGLDPQEARRQAHVHFGGLEKYKEAGRDVRGLRWLDAIALDARLGVRMLVKHRGLTLVGGFAMAVAIAIGATFFEAFSEVLEPVLPVEDGDRVVAVRYATLTPGGSERRVLHDFLAWRQHIASVEQLGAFRTAKHNLVAGVPPHEPIDVAEMTASGFAVARTPPLLGRYLVPDDERHGAPAVVVIGYQAWRSRFHSDPGVVGRLINLGGTPSTIVGVMPDGFRFPLNHQYWVPLHLDPSRYDRFRGPALYVFGRLAPGVSLEQARAEVAALGQRESAARPEPQRTLRLDVIPYTHEHLEITSPFRLWLLRIAQLLVGALVFVVAVNLAILVYARTVSRLGEIAVRTALGASRRRILAQLFVEALALTLAGAGAGLLLSHVALDRMQSLSRANGLFPFWIRLELSIATVLYAIALAAAAAVIMAVLPGMKATGQRTSVTLHELHGRGGTRLGRVWTTLVVVQVATAVAVLPAAVYVAWQVVRMGIAEPEPAARQTVIGVVAIGDEASEISADRVRARHVELLSRLEAEPGVSAVTFSSGVPGFSPGRMLRFEAAEGVKYAGDHGIDVLDVGLNFFTTYDAGILEGRALALSDLGAGTGVVVNRAFVDEFLIGNPLGVRFRYVPLYERPGRRADTSYQIVGVVRDFPAFPPQPGSDRKPTVYHPAVPGDVRSLVLSVRFSGGIPDGFTERFGAIGVSVDPALQLRRVMPLADYFEQVQSFWRLVAVGAALVTISVLLLSAAGMYAMMSFTVAQRTREIGIRAALGAHPRQLVLGIFSRALRQLTIGLLAGSLASGAVMSAAELDAGPATALLLIVAAVMLIVGLAAAVGPARRCLSIEPSEVLRADG